MPTVWRETQWQGLPLKNDPPCRRARAARRETASNVGHGRPADVRLDRLMFLDEFGAVTNMTQGYARGLSGKRDVCSTRRRHWKVLSTNAAMTARRTLCLGTSDRAIDADTFLAFVREGLALRLAAGPRPYSPEPRRCVAVV